VSEPLLSVRDLVVRFALEEGELTAVDGISFDVPKGCTVALVGESGCGKTVTAHTIMRLLPTPPARIDGGQVLFEGQDLLCLPLRRMRALRGSRISIVFQDPMTALNPVYSIGSQLREAYRIHQRISRSEAKRRAIELLRRVGFPEPDERFGDYPHELSGGMRQRVLIAMALACRPALLIADEPTTALDQLAATDLVSLLEQLRREFELSMLLISHDITMVAEIADHIVVLYAGQIVESGPAHDVLAHPQHPYTRALLQSIPPRRRHQRRRRKTKRRLPSIQGTVPDPRKLPPGCRFSNRCPEAIDRCDDQAPELLTIENPGREPVLARCLLLETAGQAVTAAGQPAATTTTEESS
jgi:oligopeptide/dipeptide ABC transporter ATP-binding protein